MSERFIPYPEVRIRNGWELTEAASRHPPKHSSANKNAVPIPDTETMNRIVTDYTEAWTPYQDPILTGLCRILGLSFSHNIIDVDIVPGFDALSHPLVIGTDYQPDHFIDILAHELSHNLLVNNTTYKDGLSVLSHWRSLFGPAHSPDTLIHIPVHASLEAIYKDVLDEPHPSGARHRQLYRQA